MLEYHHNLWSLGLAQEQAALKEAMLTRRLDELRAWDLWAFAHIARGGCSDDAFDYFRA